MPYLTKDNKGRHLSTLTIDNIELSDSGEYTCQPAAGPKAVVMVHVLQRETEVQAVLGEGKYMDRTNDIQNNREGFLNLYNDAAGSNMLRMG